MRKSLRTLIALCVVGLSSAAWAQTSIQVSNADFESDETWTLNGFNRVQNNNIGTDSYYVEKWCTSSSSLADASCSQTLTSLEAGVYKISAHGSALNQARADYRTYTTGVYLYLGDQKGEVVASNSDMTAYVYLSDAKSSVDLGIKTENTTANWVAWDNVKLTLYKDNDNDKAALKEEILNEAQAYPTKLVSEEVQAVNQASELSEICNAVVSLQKKMRNNYQYAAAAEVLPQMKALTESTNFYTADALETYYTQWKTKYDECTLTTDEANALIDPYAYLSYHSAKTCDEFLMSTFDVKSDDTNGSWNTYYINSWSKEEENDDDGFKTPFFEYWTSDATLLAEKTITATMTNLAAGTYSVTAWVRVRLSDGQTGSPTGITMQVNSGEEVDVCTGTAGSGSSASQLYRGYFTATGTVGEDGDLVLKFKVASSNNINWLAFKDVNYTAADQVTFDEKAVENSTYFATYTTKTAVDLDKCEFKAYGVSVSGTTVTKTELSGIVPAKTPLLLTASEAKTYDVIGTTAAGTAVTTDLKSADGTVKGDESTIYTLNFNNGELGWYLKAKDVAVTADKCYIQTSEASGVKFLGFSDDDATGINGVSSSKKNAARYNLSGQRVGNDYKGIVIENGKKYLVK